ncbi:MAG: class I SAM-dependent methyltransferase [Spirochaetota bacterium]
MRKHRCPVCHGAVKPLFSDGKDYFILQGKSPDFGIDLCDACGLGFTFPPMTDEELSHYYPDDYEAYVPKRSFSAMLQTWKYASDISMIKKHVRGGRMLEIGCGRGEFLFEAQKHGFSVEGIEPSASGRKFAQDHFGISVRKGFAENAHFSGRYDVIVMRHVLEHVNDFQQCLKNIARNGLLPNGILFLKLPRMDSWEARYYRKFWSGYDTPRHRVHFSLRGIVSTLHDLGFSTESAQQEIVPADLIRSIGYRYHSKGPSIRNIFGLLFTHMPSAFKLVFAQIVCILLSPLKAGRMIVTARTDPK